MGFGDVKCQKPLFILGFLNRAKIFSIIYRVFSMFGFSLFHVGN